MTIVQILTVVYAEEDTQRILWGPHSVQNTQPDIVMH